MSIDYDPLADLADPADTGIPPPEHEPAPERDLVYGSAQDFLIHQLLPSYIRRNDGKEGLWCPEWYKHAEAISRINALWRAWEHLRWEPSTGMSVWWRDHADHHMRVLYDPQGPFHSCSPDKHYDPKPIQVLLAPEGWFPDERENPAL